MKLKDGKVIQSSLHTGSMYDTWTKELVLRNPVRILGRKKLIQEKR